MKCIRCEKEFKHPSVGNACNTSFHLFHWGGLDITIQPKAYRDEPLLCYACIKAITDKISKALFEDKA